MDLIQCLFISTCTLSVLFTIYHFMIRDATSLMIRRASLLFILGTTILLPFIQFDSKPYVNLSSDDVFDAPEIEYYTLSEVDLLDEQKIVLNLESIEQVVVSERGNSENSFWTTANRLKINNWLLMVYLVGLLVVSLRFFGQLIHFFYTVFRHEKVQKNGHHFVLLNTPNYAATFLHYILISRNIWESKDKSLIIQHECIHAHFRHSFDRFLTEIVCLFQWFNPFIYWFRKNLIEVHEYQVDRALVTSGVDAIQYQQLLAKYASLSNQLAFGNHFSHSLTFNRIKMIAQNKSFQKYSIYRLFLLLPAVVLLCSIFSFQTAETIEPTDNNLTIDGVTAPLIPAKVDFAGELLPMDNFDAKERFDRELISNCFRHSSTLLFLKKANRYFPIIEPILAEYGIPDDVKYLAVAESALSNAISPMGAKGIWQFMPGSAKGKGLEVTDEVDERYHLEKATVAACKYLKEAHDQFNSWTLAAAAYNMGGPGLRKQLKKQGGDNYFDLDLNKETARYVLRIMAIKTIMQAPNTYGFNLAKKDLYPPMPKFKTIEENGSIPDLGAYAQKYNISYRMLKLYNPWLLEDELTNKEQKVYRIKIPV